MNENRGCFVIEPEQSIFIRLSIFLYEFFVYKFASANKKTNGMEIPKELNARIKKCPKTALVFIYIVPIELNQLIYCEI